MQGHSLDLSVSRFNRDEEIRQFQADYAKQINELGLDSSDVGALFNSRNYLYAPLIFICYSDFLKLGFSKQQIFNIFQLNDLSDTVDLLLSFAYEEKKIKPGCDWEIIRLLQMGDDGRKYLLQNENDYFFRMAQFNSSNPINPPIKTNASDLSAYFEARDMMQKQLFLSEWVTACQQNNLLQDLNITLYQMGMYTDDEIVNQSPAPDPAPAPAPDPYPLFGGLQITPINARYKFKLYQPEDLSISPPKKKQKINEKVNFDWQSCKNLNDITIEALGNIKCETEHLVYGFTHILGQSLVKPIQRTKEGYITLSLIKRYFPLTRAYLTRKVWRLGDFAVEDYAWKKIFFIGENQEKLEEIGLKWKDVLRFMRHENSMQQAPLILKYGEDLKNSGYRSEEIVNCILNKTEEDLQYLLDLKLPQPQHQEPQHADEIEKNTVFVSTSQPFKPSFNFEFLDSVQPCRENLSYLTPSQSPMSLEGNLSKLKDRLLAMDSLSDQEANQLLLSSEDLQSCSIPPSHVSINSNNSKLFNPCGLTFFEEESWLNQEVESPSEIEQFQGNKSPFNIS